MDPRIPPKAPPQSAKTSFYVGILDKASWAIVILEAWKDPFL